MSLILEALRRSERERHRQLAARTPGVLSMSAPVDPLERRRASAAVLVLVAALGIAGGLWWSTRGTPATPLPDRDRGDPPTMASSPVNVRPLASLATQTSAPLPAATPVMATAPTRTTISRAQPDASPAVSETPPAEPATAVTATLPPEPESPDPVAATTADQPMQRITDLMPAERGRLPPMRVTMFVYAEDQARRVLWIDGRRVQEGDTLAPGLVLTRIDRDGAELDWEGSPLWLSRP